MSLPVDFGEDNKVYGLLFPLGPREKPCWNMSFYTTERGRKRGATYLVSLMGSQCPIYKFELPLAEIVKRSSIVPFLPKDRPGALERVVKIEKTHMKSERPKYKDN